ncbi:MAG: hypothetical protein VB106_10110, partial [Clostridiaceae bacterium]|nr:hypothetical protein [Clostridiaceae bacterium]
MVPNEKEVVEMYLKKRIIPYILTAALVSGSLIMPASGAEVSYTGTASGDALIKNAAFNDIGSSSSAENIMKMSIYSIIREYGS